jgi:hypothetical protein
MNCPLQTRDNVQQLLDYCVRKLDPQTAVMVERHIAMCRECHEFVEQQRAVWEALDSWEAAPVSHDFNRRLYARIENDVPWWQMLLRPLTLRWNVAASVAGVFVVLTAGLLLNRPTAIVPPVSEGLTQVQPEQVEQALDAMDMLAEFDRHVKAGKSPNAKM